ncbi:MAG: TIGR03617 family F420-dependent LLM class oxidoreductase [Pseudomonadota bacterium]
MIRIDAPLYAAVAQAAEEAKRLAAEGFDGVYTLEGNTDPFFPLLLASEHAPELDIATGIAVAFPRNPSHLAYQAWDLQKFSQGKFLLGLGSQIKTHIENRFGCDFSRPAARMREHILAIKAFFDCWQDGKRLDFQGEFTRHTLMTPMFNAGENPYGKPPILLGALGPKMTEVAGEVAEGIIMHPFNNQAFIEQRALPAVRKGLAKAGRDESEFVFSLGAMIATGENEESMQAAKDSIKGLLGFYASTPAYVPPMAAIGYADLQGEANRLSKEGKWEQMADLIDDTFFEAFCIYDEPQNIPKRLASKYGSLPNRLSFYTPYATPPGFWKPIIEQAKGCT